MRACFFLIVLTCTIPAFSQSAKTLYLHRERTLSLSARKFTINVNNQTIVLKNGNSTKLSLNVDSVRISLQNKGLKKASRQIRMPLEIENYVLIYIKEGNIFRNSRDSIIIEKVCKECFETTQARSQQAQ